MPLTFTKFYSKFMKIKQYEQRYLCKLHDFVMEEKALQMAKDKTMKHPHK